MHHNVTNTVSCHSLITTYGFICQSIYMHVVCADINFSLSNSLKDRKKLDPVESKLAIAVHANCFMTNSDHLIPHFNGNIAVTLGHKTTFCSANQYQLIQLCWGKLKVTNSLQLIFSIALSKKIVLSLFRSHWNLLLKDQHVNNETVICIAYILFHKEAPILDYSPAERHATLFPAEINFKNGLWAINQELVKHILMLF